MSRRKAGNCKPATCSSKSNSIPSDYRRRPGQPRPEPRHGHLRPCPVSKTVFGSCPTVYPAYQQLKHASFQYMPGAAVTDKSCTTCTGLIHACAQPVLCWVHKLYWESHLKCRVTIAAVPTDDLLMPAGVRLSSQAINAGNRGEPQTLLSQPCADTVLWYCQTRWHPLNVRARRRIRIWSSGQRIRRRYSPDPKPLTSRGRAVLPGAMLPERTASSSASGMDAALVLP